MNIILRDITKENYIPLLKLAVGEKQKHQVAPNAVSLAQAHFEGNAICKGIYAGDEPVGFIMLEDEKDDKGVQQFSLWRFMIDEKHQGKGYGRNAMDLLIQYSREQTGQKEFFLSCVPGEGSAEGFYEKYGFEFTGDYEEDEKIYKISLP